MNQFLVFGYFKVTFSVIGFILFISTTNSCAYKLSNKVDTLPKNVKSIFIPVFENKSAEPLIETLFTDSMRRETLKSGYAQVANSEATADAVLIGTINGVNITANETVNLAEKTEYLPNGTVLAASSKVTVDISLVLKKKGSSEILWSGNYTQSRGYTPPQLTLPTINSANSLYNLSVRRQTLANLSQEMMQLAFDRLVDNF